MARTHGYFTYILASRSRTLYVGVTNELLYRVSQHRAGKAGSFTARYRVYRLVYFERYFDINEAIAREKYLKHCTRQEKLRLIERDNPTWQDFAERYLPRTPSQTRTADPPPAAKDDRG